MPSPVLIFMHGPVAGRRVDLAEDELTLGRGNQNDVVLGDPLVSRVHAILMRRGGVMLIEDLGSHNGTYVNEERLHGIRQLHHGDRIVIGQSRILFEDPAFTGDEPTQISERVAFPAQVFTQRQIQVVRLAARGLSNKQIGDRLTVSERTVKAYLTSIFEKLGVSNRAAAVAEALRLGLIEMPRDDQIEGEESSHQF